MASLSNDGNKRWRIGWTIGNENKRRTLHLFDTTVKTAREIHTKIEALITAKVTKTSIAMEVAEWVRDVDATFHAKLVRLGLTEPRIPLIAPAPPSAKTLKDLNTEYFASLNVKDGTKAALKQGADSLIKYFGENKPLPEIDALAVDKYQQWLYAGKIGTGKDAKPIATATISKRLQTIKRMFRKALRWKMINDNPFADVKPPGQTNDSRLFEVTRAMIDKVLEKCPDAQWKLIVCLARYGGLRTPSETLSLKWTDVDFENGRIRIPSPKTARYAGKDSRMIPLFPELRQPLMDVFTPAPVGTEYVITAYRLNNMNLRTQFKRIIERAGLTSWPRLFQNLRSTRATELAQTFPAYVAAAWLGHSQEVARDHYWQIQDTHFEQAAQSTAQAIAQTNAQSTPESVRIDKKPQNIDETEKCEKVAVLPVFPAETPLLTQEPTGRGWIRTTAITDTKTQNRDTHSAPHSTKTGDSEIIALAEALAKLSKAQRAALLEKLGEK